VIIISEEKSKQGFLSMVPAPPGVRGLWEEVTFSAKRLL